MTKLSNNSDFLFIYEASNCNPNGDPDQENKPRMDIDTNTNLVTDIRLKRYIRDYLMSEGVDIFVSMEDGSKVSPDTKLEYSVNKILSNNTIKAQYFEDNSEMKAAFEKITKDKDENAIFKALKDKANKELNYFILDKIIKDSYIDIRLFGGAFAVKTFTHAYTGPVQLNWGYSLNEVFLINSESIVTIMNDDSSTFGKDYRVHYSLLAFHGSINKNAAKATGLSTEDVDQFRTAIWNSIPSLPTRSKINQYPKLYIEIIYNDGFTNGHFGDLRNLIECKPSSKAERFKRVRKYKDLQVDFSQLESLVKANKGKGKAIKEVILRSADGVNFSL